MNIMGKKYRNKELIIKLRFKEGRRNSILLVSQF